jgi:hypothetical protein
MSDVPIHDMSVGVTDIICALIVLRHLLARAAPEEIACVVMKTHEDLNDISNSLARASLPGPTVSDGPFDSASVQITTCI